MIFDQTMLEELREHSDLGSTSSMTTDSQLTYTNKRSKHLMIEDVEQLSVTSQEINAHQMAHTAYMQGLFNHTRVMSKKKNEKDRSIQMKGRTLYNFPTVEVLEEMNDNKV